MKQVKVNVEFLPVVQGTINGYELPEGNNITGANNSLSIINGGESVFVLGASELGAEPFYNTKVKYNGFFSNRQSDSNGNTDITIEVVGEDIDNFMMIFDNVAHQFATDIYVDDKLWKNTNNIFIWHGEKANSHTIRIIKWNKPLYPVRITSLRVGISLTYDSSYLHEVTRGSQSMADNKLPSYGVISSYGSVSFIDKDKELVKLAELNLLKPNLKIQIFYGDEKIGEYESEKWSYSYGNSRAKVELKDSTQRWYNRVYDKSVNVTLNESALDIYNKLKLESNEIFAPLDSELESYLEDINVSFSYIDKCSLFDAWNKLCNLACLQMYKAEDGRIVTIRWQ